MEADDDRVERAAARRAADIAPEPVPEPSAEAGAAPEENQDMAIADEAEDTIIEDVNADIDEEIEDAVPAMRIARARWADLSDAPEPAEVERAARQRRQQRQRQERAPGLRLQGEEGDQGYPGQGQEAASSAAGSARPPQAVQAAANPDDLVCMINHGSRVELEPREHLRRLGAVAGCSEGAVRHTATELFSPPRVNAKIRSTVSGLTAGSSFDLIVDQNTGEAWNFLSTEHRRRCWSRLKAEDPWVVIGSPPCTAFSVLNYGLSRYRMNPEKRERQLVEGKISLAFALSAYEWQVRRGRYFLHEHPASAESWKMDEVRAIQCMDGVATVTGDSCMFGMKSVDAEGIERPAKKPTRWMSNAPYLLRSLGIRCHGGHTHTELLGGRARAAAKYPPELVLAIVRGLQAQREADARARGERMPCSEALVQAVAADRAGWNYKTVFDEYTGEPLDPELVRQAKDEEMRYFKTKGFGR